MERKADDGNGKHYARRRTAITIAGWFIGPILTVMGLWLTSWIDIVVSTRESPKRIQVNVERLDRIQQQLSAMQLQLSVIQTRLNHFEQDRKNEKAR